MAISQSGSFKITHSLLIWLHNITDSEKSNRKQFHWHRVHLSSGLTFSPRERERESVRVLRVGFNVGWRYIALIPVAPDDPHPAVPLILLHHTQLLLRRDGDGALVVAWRDATPARLRKRALARRCERQGRAERKTDWHVPWKSYRAVHCLSTSSKSSSNSA